jgi:hypothetical protein
MTGSRSSTWGPRQALRNNGDRAGSSPTIVHGYRYDNIKRLYE